MSEMKWAIITGADGGMGTEITLWLVIIRRKRRLFGNV